ncbi:MAG TPA: DUF6370 family protein [Vicinamibacteria bacterium]|nr:DUF6370 family protein [Vicinamibacteria bacterium]
MKMVAKLSLALAVVLALVAGAYAADETTITGSVMCAKCNLKKADATKCQDVVVAADGTEYYVAKNDVSTKFGHVCKDSKAATVTGKVTEKDGKKWIEPSKMEAAQQKS